MGGGAPAAARPLPRPCLALWPHGEQEARARESWVSEELLRVPNGCLSLSVHAGLFIARASSHLRLGRKTPVASALGRADHEPAAGDISETRAGERPVCLGLSSSLFLKEFY